MTTFSARLQPCGKISRSGQNNACELGLVGWVFARPRTDFKAPPPHHHHHHHHHHLQIIKMQLRLHILPGARGALSRGVKLCTYLRWFARPDNCLQSQPTKPYHELPLLVIKLRSIVHFRVFLVGPHSLPIEKDKIWEARDALAFAQMHILYHTDLS